MKLVKSLALATLVASVVAQEQQPNQADWAKHVQKAKARTRAYVDSGALDQRKQAVQDRVGSKTTQHDDEEASRHLQTIDGTILPNGRFRTGTKAVRENAKLRRHRLYSDGLWLIGRRVYRDYPHLMAGEEAEGEGEEFYLPYDEEVDGYEAEGEETAEEATAAPGQRALYSSPNFDARKDQYSARADAHVSNAKNRAEYSKDKAKNSGWYPTDEGEAQAAPEDGEKEAAAPAETEKEAAAPAESEKEEAAPAEEEKKEAAPTRALAEDLSQASEMYAYDITDPTTKMTYVGKGVAHAANGVGRAVSRGATVAEREADFAVSHAELAYKNKVDNEKAKEAKEAKQTKSKLRGRKA